MANKLPTGPPPLSDTILPPEKVAQVQVDFTWYGDPSHDDAVAVEAADINNDDLGKLHADVNRMIKESV